MSEQTIARLTLLCCLLLLGCVAWSGLQIRDLAQSWAVLDTRRPPVTITTSDVANQSGTKATITTTRGAEEATDVFIARHLAAVNAWKSSTG